MMELTNQQTSQRARAPELALTRFSAAGPSFQARITRPLTLGFSGSFSTKDFPKSTNRIIHRGLINKGLTNTME